MTFTRIVIFVSLTLMLAGRHSSAQVTELPSATDSAALQYYRSGVAAMRDRDFDQALRQLDRAITIEPNNDAYHAALSAAYLGKRNLRPAWDAARKAYRLGPSNRSAADQLQAVWSVFGSQGAFRAGKSTDEIRQSLGGPDRVNSKGANERWLYGYHAVDFANGKLFSTTDLRGLPGRTISPIRLVFQPDPEIWQVSLRRISRDVAATEFEPIDSAAAADHRLMIQRLYGQVRQGVSPRKWMEQARSQAVPANTAIDWSVLAEDEYGLLYRWSLPATERRPGHWELTRVLQGAKDLHRISFMSAQPVDTTQAEAWKRALMSARLVKPKSLHGG